MDAQRLAEVISHGSGGSFALSRIISGGGTVDSIAAHAGTLLQKDVRLAADLAAAVHASTGAVMTAADDALARMHHRR